MKIQEIYSELVSYKENGCITWEGPTCASGRYGRVNGFSKIKTAHRLSYELVFGEIPENLVVMHSCDNGLCVNSDHLSLGTQSDNMLDCAAKNRHPGMFKNQSGENNANAKPNLIQRNESIRNDKLLGLSYSQLKLKYGIKSNGHLRVILLSLGFD